MDTVRRLRTKKQQREFERKVTLVIGLDWLTERPSRARARIARFIELLITADEDSRSLRQSGASLNENPHGKSRLFSHLRQLTDILSDYKGTRCLWVGENYEIQEFFSLDSKRLQTDDEYYIETRIINYALELLRRGTISNLRTCRECKKWFYAVTKHQKHCSEGCRQKFASHDQSFKDRRREYMKKYRQGEREREQHSRGLFRSRRR